MWEFEHVGVFTMSDLSRRMTGVTWHNFSCVLVARGSGGGMEKEKMPAGCQRSDGETENLGKFGSAVHELHELARKNLDIRTIIWDL